MYIVEQLDMPGTAAIKHSAPHRSSDIALWMGDSDEDKQGFGPGLLNFEWTVLAGKEDSCQQAAAPSFLSLVCPCASSMNFMSRRQSLQMGTITHWCYFSVGSKYLRAVWYKIIASLFSVKARTRV